MKKNVILFLTVLFSFLLLGISYSQPVMNEIYSLGVAGNLDWIEIYNPSESQIDISGYKIYDSGAIPPNTKPKKLFPPGTLIPAKGFYVIITDTADFVGDQSKFGLSSTNGETVWLEDASGTLIDTCAFPPPPTATSYGRNPDGSSNWMTLTTITRGTSNNPTRIEGEFIAVSEYNLDQNYPNPFNPSTTISYHFAQAGFVTLKVFNILGKEVASLVSEIQNAGSYRIKFDAKNLSSGIYLYQLNVGSFSETKKFTLMK